MIEEQMNNGYTVAAVEEPVKQSREIEIIEDDEIDELFPSWKNI